MSDNEGAESEAPAAESADDAERGGEAVESAAEGAVAEAELPDEVADDLVERAEESPERVAREVAALRERRAALEADLAAAKERTDDLESKLKRERADFQNYKKRQERRREELQQRATEDLVERLLDVRDNLQRALDQDEDADIRDGVASTLDQFDRILASENVERIEPAAGDAVDPERHEVLTTVEADQPAGSVVDLYRPGYEMAGRIIRPAQVTVSDE
ncbi:MAG: nucleotide exchange factor GrpE [Haloarculaceae archaeon]